MKYNNTFRKFSPLRFLAIIFPLLSMRKLDGIKRIPYFFIPSPFQAFLSISCVHSKLSLLIAFFHNSTLLSSEMLMILNLHYFKITYNLVSD